jgi:predicted aconitase with swiveling domain
METLIHGRCILPGRAAGPLLVTAQAISFWGGVDPVTGRVIDPRHPLFDEFIHGHILAFPHGKGSSTGSLMMLELIRIGKAPAGIVNVRTEPILATGPIVGRHLYGRSVPMMTVSQKDFTLMKNGCHAELDAASGVIKLTDG